LMAGINDLASISEGNSILIAASINCMGYYIKGFFHRKVVSQKDLFANRKMINIIPWDHVTWCHLVFS
ncbi:MAG: hypothetical protein WA421_04515, partial [Nitrososphaeraceae archaeon]